MPHCQRTRRDGAMSFRRARFAVAAPMPLPRCYWRPISRRYATRSAWRTETSFTTRLLNDNHHPAGSVSLPSSHSRPPRLHAAEFSRHCIGNRMGRMLNDIDGTVNGIFRWVAAARCVRAGSADADASERSSAMPYAAQSVTASLPRSCPPPSQQLPQRERRRHMLLLFAERRLV